MICIFEISSSEVPDFKRLIYIGSEHTFDDLHRIIQNTSDFDQSQIASFFLADDFWRKQIEISSLDSGIRSPKVLSIRKTKLDEYITEIGQKLIYVFDFFNERFFYLELKEKIMKTDLREPFVAYEKGHAPVQFLNSDLDNTEVDLIESKDSYKSFGDLEDYYEIFGEMDA
ncbi:MAG TPA: hypothetical protein VFC65_13255 [Prolixibacteraceae bacterium]|nr:hypothetical protein [Prolixibacteraceae bacterium]